MSTSSDSKLPSWEEHKPLTRDQMTSKNWRVAKRLFLDCSFISAILFLGAWVLMLKLSREPGVHLQVFNKTGQKLTDVKLKFSWSEYVMPVLPGAPRDGEHKPYGAIIQRIGIIDEQATTLNVEWTDAKGVRQRHIEKELYLSNESVKISVTFFPDGTVKVR